MKYYLKILIPVFFGAMLMFQSAVNSSTADSASLSPAGVLLDRPDLNTRATIRFEATNDTTGTLRTYHAEFSYSPGLDIVMTTQPPAKTATVDAQKKLIVLEWASIGPGVILSADLSVASQAAGAYAIVPVTVYYLDSSRVKHVASCNGATITVQQDTTAPEAPTHVRSEAREGSIQVSWWGASALDIAGYNIYRRSPTAGFTKLNSAPLSNAAYQDTTVQNGDAYYYAATTIDSSGNESPLSEETGATYYDLKIRSIPATGVMAAAVGDINGDGNADIVLSLYYTEVTKKTTTSGHKVDIYFGGNSTGIPDVTIKGEKLDDGFGTSLAVIDMNNDGYDDVIVVAATYTPPNPGFYDGERGKVYVYAGGLQMSAVPAFTAVGNQSFGNNGTSIYWTAERLGASLAPSGDLNGDGYQDIVVGAPMGGMDRSGRILVLHGNYRLDWIWEEESWCPTPWQFMGTSVATVGDVNGDGYPEIISGGPANNSHNTYGKAYLFTGGPSLQPVFLYSSGVANDGFGTLVGSAGDMNGDGYDDIAVTSWVGAVHYAQDAQIRPFFGGPQLENTPGRYLYQSTGHIMSLGDVNHDGYDDIAADGPTVYFGNAVNDNIADFLRTGASLLAVGDVDGDGVKDLVTQTTTTVKVLSIAPYLTLPDIIFTSPHDHAKTGNPGITVQGTVKGGAARLLVKGQVVPVQPDGAFTADVSLVLGDNAFEVIAEMQDGKISKRKMTVTYVIPDPLVLAITSPVDNTVVDVDSMTVSGTVSDSQASISVNGVQAIVSHGSFTATGVALAEGINTVTATAQDEYGQTTSKSITVVLTSRGTITGTLTDSSTGAPLAGVAVSIMDAVGTKGAMNAPDGSYSIAGVKQGNFTATFEKSGYVTRTESGSLIAGQTLTLDAALSFIPPLTLAITSPADGATAHASALQVSGLVSNNAPVTVNGYAASVSNGAFVATIPIQEGGNIITAEASDQYGQAASRSISVTLAGLQDNQEIFLTPTVLAFSPITENTSWIQYLIVSNIGTENLAIGGIGGQYLPYRIVSNDCSGAILAPSESCSIAVTFSPPSAGTFTRTISIPSNDMDHPYYAVTLTGTAIAYVGGYVVPDTGQKVCTGEYPKNPLSYTLPGDGTVVDNNTGLLWQQTSSGLLSAHADAGNYCGSLDLAGLTGWRLPTRNELLSIVDYGRYQPAIDPDAFPGTSSVAYWSSTDDSSNAWAVDFGNGSASMMPKNVSAMVRCVLGPPRGVVPYWDNGDRTVTDLENGLMWVQQQITNTATQEGAANVCAGITVAGYTDWRVPTIKELAANRFNNCFMGDCRLWSSTVLDPSACSQGYMIDLTTIAAESKANYHLLTCVRGGRTKQTLTAPVISGPTVAAAAEAAVVTWTTDQPTYGAVEYGTTFAYGSTVTDPIFTTEHHVTLNGLLPATTYHVKVTSSNSAGLSATTADMEFTTASPPAITGVIVAAITTDAAIIAWTTDQPTDSLVSYGTTTAYGSAASDTTMTTSHSVTLTGLAPSRTYHFRVTSKNAYDLSATSNDIAFTTGNLLAIAITSPTDGANISRPDMTVKGTIMNSAGNETGVTVNGIVATVTGSEFIANHVPLQEGANTITVNAIDTAGGTATSSITVTAATSGRYITLTPTMLSGTSPLEVLLKIDGSFTITNSDLSSSGPGPVEYLPGTAVDEYKVRMTAEGIYSFTAEVTDDQNNTYMDTVEVVVQNKAAMDALLKAKWEGMKGAMIAADVHTAASYFITGKQEQYAGIFAALGGSLSQIAQNMQTISMIYVLKDVAKFRIRRLETEGEITYYIYFVKDENGLWKIQQF